MSDIYNKNDVNMNNQNNSSNRVYHSSPFPSSGAEAYNNNANVSNNQAYEYASGTYNQTVNSEVVINDKYDATIKSESNELSAQKYNLIIGLTLLWGFFFNYLIIKFIDPIMVLDTLGAWFILLYFVFAMAGSFMFKKSSNPVISFIGYNMIVLPLGILLSITLYGFSTDLIGTAILLTGIITLVMMTLGVVFPKVFEKIGTALGVALLVTVIIETIFLFIPNREVPFIDYIVVFIFCGYIGYDWGKANAMPKTVDNAIDGAAAIYLDIINLFIRILSIMAKNRRR